MAYSTLRLQTMALLRSQLINQALQSSGSVDSLIYHTLMNAQPRDTGRDISNAALTGRIRSDAGMLRQASKNVSEGGSILTLAATATQSISAALTRMQTLAQGVADGTLTPAAQTEYNTLAANISGTIASTAYNGISLLNGNAWAGDERLSVSGSGLQKTGTLGIQAGTSSRPLTLTDLSSLESTLAGTDLSNTTNAAAAATTISNLLGSVNTLDQSYESQAGNFSSEAKSLKRQAGILAATAARAQQNPEVDSATLLLDMLLKERGRLFVLSS